MHKIKSCKGKGLWHPKYNTIKKCAECLAMVGYGRNRGARKLGISPTAFRSWTISIPALKVVSAPKHDFIGYGNRPICPMGQSERNVKNEKRLYEKYRESLSDGYIRNRLFKSGISGDDITEPLMRFKRIKILLSRHLKKAAKPICIPRKLLHFDKEKKRHSDRVSTKKARSELRDSYVRASLKRQMKTQCLLHINEFPPEMLEVKRMAILLNRKLKIKKTQTNQK